MKTSWKQTGDSSPLRDLESSRASSRQQPTRLQRLTDITVIGYLLVTAGLAVGGRDSVNRWELLVTTHLILIGMIVLVSRTELTRRPVLRFLRQWYPVLLFSPAFKEVELLAGKLGNWKLTGKIQGWDRAWFGADWSMELSRTFPSVLFSEYLHFCYLSFVLLVPMIGGYWYFTGKRGPAAELIFLTTVTTYLSYLFFILLPVDSPFYLYPQLDPLLSGHFFYELVHGLSSRAGARGGAFPSCHVSVTTVVWLVAWRNQRPLARWLLLVVLAIPVATVYGRFHYVLDVFAGLALGLTVVLLYQLLPTSQRPAVAAE